MPGIFGARACKGTCGCESCTVTLCVFACSTLDTLSGILVQANLSGVVKASGTTGADGCVTLTIPSANTYLLALTGPSLTEQVNVSQALTCGGSTFPIDVGENVAGFCCNGCLILQDGATWTDANGTIPLFFNPGGDSWSGCGSSPGQTVMTFDAGEACICADETTTGTVPYNVSLTCVSGGIQLLVDWPVILCDSVGVTPSFLSTVVGGGFIGMPSQCAPAPSPPCSNFDTDENCSNGTGVCNAGINLTQAPASCSDTSITFTMPAMGGPTGGQTINPAGTTGVFAFNN
jgi:hypothetical protein